MTCFMSLNILCSTFVVNMKFARAPASPPRVIALQGPPQTLVPPRATAVSLQGGLVPETIYGGGISSYFSHISSSFSHIPSCFSHISLCFSHISHVFLHISLIFLHVFHIFLHIFHIFLHISHIFFMGSCNRPPARNFSTIF